MAYIYISSDSDSQERNMSEDENGESSYSVWKDDLETCLDTIESAGDFAGSKSYSAFVNPGLEVSGSPIPLPLTLRDAQTLRSSCRQAPYGKGEATLVDESVRKTWELGCDQFSLGNPDWHEFIDTLLRDVVHPLGMTNIRADPYKLLLYEEGSFFKKHKDSEKAPGMVGTLVICLPAKHEGGDVHLSHAGRERVFPTSQSSAFSLTALAWFSDVTHEIKQVTSGYRLVLTYNIIQTRKSGPSSAGFFVKQQMQLQRLISEWKAKYPGVKRLLYCLEHQYTESSLSLENLKGRDHAVCQTLYSCLETGRYLLFANLTYSEDDDGYGGDETGLTIDWIYSTSGSKIASDVDVEEEDIIGKSPYEARDPDSESEGEYTGNEDLVNHSTDPSARKFAVKFITKMLKTPAGVDKTVLSDIYYWGVNLKIDVLLRKVIRASVTLSTSDELLITIAGLVNKKFKDISSPQPEWDSWLGEYISCVQSLTDLTSILHTFGRLLVNEALKESFKNWRTTAEGQKLESKETYELHDHDYIMKIMVSHSGDLNWIQSNLIPKLVERGSKPPFYILVGWLLRPDFQKSFKHAVTVSKDIVEGAQEKLVLETTDFAYSPAVPGGNTAQLPRAFVQFIGNCLKQGFKEQVERLLDSTSSHIDYVKQVMGETRYCELVMLESTRTSDSGDQVAEHDERTKADDSVGDSKPAKRRRNKERNTGHLRDILTNQLPDLPIRRAPPQHSLNQLRVISNNGLDTTSKRHPLSATWEYTITNDGLHVCAFGNRLTKT
ncbi:putative 2og-fe oxygenase protein [Eutypa lata UCREL1]|uniref:Putative 2og-fe oxygenase protein n=1 Tax=Eutypa lata (strain UCR-EL1) TaxID=1287681 RepID=M7SRE3_EUTLA|nr:putative 2og-fe oxygenase protein [Eutypa lata UCREL1]